MVETVVAQIVSHCLSFTAFVINTYRGRPSTKSTLLLTNILSPWMELTAGHGSFGNDFSFDWDVEYILAGITWPCVQVPLLGLQYAAQTSRDAILRISWAYLNGIHRRLLFVVSQYFATHGIRKGTHHVNLNYKTTIIVRFMYSDRTLSSW